MRAFRNVLIGLILCAVAVGFAAYLLLRNGLAADAAPGRIETAVARRLVRLSIPRSMRERSNPHASDPDAWRKGAEHFADHCTVCHGGDGRGATAFGPRMYPPVPNLASADLQALTDGELFAIIQHGVRWTGMPAFRSAHSDDETWRLVAFIRRLPSTTSDLQPHRHGDSPDHGAGTAEGRSIAIDGTSFNPPQLTVRVGDTVVWKTTIRFRTTSPPQPARSRQAISIRRRSGDSARGPRAAFRMSAPFIPG